MKKMLISKTKLTLYLQLTENQIVKDGAAYQESVHGKGGENILNISMDMKGSVLMS